MSWAPISTAAANLSRWLVDVLSEDKPPHGPGVTVRGAGAPTMVDPLPVEMQTRLKRMLAGGARAAVGMHLIGFDTLKARLGPRWPLVLHRVQGLTERLIQQSAGEHDIWFRLGDENYVIVFATLGKQQAQLVCAKLVEQLHTLLLGDPDAAHVTVETMIMKVGGSTLVERHSLAELLSDATRRDDDDVLETTGTLSSPDTAMSGMSLVPASTPADLTGVEMWYQPIWDTQHKAISAYLCRPHRRGRDGGGAWGYDILSQPDNGDQCLALDLLGLDESIATVDDLHRNRFRLMLVLPLHFETMASATRRQTYLAHCHSIPRHLLRYIMFVLVGLPIGIPVGRLAEIVSALKPYSRIIMANADPRSANLQVFAAAGINGVGTDLPFVQQRDLSPAEAQRMVASAQKAKLLTYIGDIRAPETALLLQEAGILFIHGPAVGPAQEFPSHMARFTADDLRQRLAEAH